MLVPAGDNSLKFPTIHYLEDDPPTYTSECCWEHMTVPLGQYVIGLRVTSDTTSLVRIDFLLGGQEVRYPSIDGFIDFG